MEKIVLNAEVRRCRPEDRPEDRYPEFSQALTNNFTRNIEGSVPLFMTDAADLYDIFLNALPEEGRQHYRCRTCRSFVDRFGGLVTISDKGQATTAIWSEDDIPEFFAPAVEAVRKVVNKARVLRVFLIESQVLGQPVTGEWTHMHVILNKDMVFDPSKTDKDNAWQQMKQLEQDYDTLVRGLKKYPIDVVDKALTILRSDAIYRSEQVLGYAEWLKALHTARNSTKNTRIIENITWLFLATAPSGFPHVSESVLATLFDDIKDEVNFKIMTDRFAYKIAPMRYRRPKADPTVGNILTANKLIEKFECEKSFVRRYATLEELKPHCLWVEKEEEKQEGDETPSGMFSHLLPNNKPKKQSNDLALPAKVMTFRKFSEDILPNAKSIEYLVDRYNNNYMAVTTAVHPDAPPILQWDNEEKRNTFSTYAYTEGSRYTRWGLQPGYCKVNAICNLPQMWQPGFDHQGKGVLFILDGAKDQLDETPIGNALFPSMLQSKFNSISSTIEAYSAKAVLEGYDESSACGIAFSGASTQWDAIFKVTTNDGTTLLYKLVMFE